MKKIAFRITKFPRPSETFITEQITLAIDLGYDVVIIVDEVFDISESTQQELILKYDLLNKVYVLPSLEFNSSAKKWGRKLKDVFSPAIFKGIRLFNPFKYGRQGINGYYFVDFCRYRKALKGVDCIHIQFGVAAGNLDVFKKANLLNGGLITTFHGFDIHFDQKNKLARKTYYKGLFEAGTVFTCNTQYLADQASELGCPEDKLKVVHVPIDTQKFLPAEEKVKEGQFKILSIGRLIKWKGQKYGVLAVNELKKKGISVSYRIIGEGEEFDNLKELIEELGLTSEVQLVGKKSQVEIVKELQQADLFLMTSVCDETGRRETQGVVTGEAQSCGVPAIGFRSGGVPYTIQDGKTGFLCEEFDYVDMSAKIESIIADEELYQQMSGNAREFILSTFSKEVIAKEWSEIYDSAINIS